MVDALLLEVDVEVDGVDAKALFDEPNENVCALLLLFAFAFEVVVFPNENVLLALVVLLLPNEKPDVVVLEVVPPLPNVNPDMRGGNG